jgi:hypothetical protein
VKTLEKILVLASDGATVLMQQLPGDVPGLSRLAERRKKFNELLTGLVFKPIAGTTVKRATTGKGQVLLSEDVNQLLKQAAIRHESLPDQDIQFIRNLYGNTKVYFLVNRGKRPVDRMVPLSTPVGSAVLYNPMTGEYGKALVGNAQGKDSVYLQLKCGESCLVQIYPKEIKTHEYAYYKPLSTPDTLRLKWELSFISGGPALPGPVIVKNTTSWTEISGEAYRSFSGTADYKTSFTLPDHSTYWQLDLGRVANSARITLNGKEMATLICPPILVLSKRS